MSSPPAVDVAPLLPAAQPIVSRAAEVYLAHSRPWFVGLIVHGSALKGGAIPGCSDIDLQLYLRADAFDEHGDLPLSVALAIHRELSGIDPAPFQYIQCYPLPASPIDVMPRFTAPVPGGYHVLAGRLPIPEATAAELVEDARMALSAAAGPRGAANHLLQHGG